MTGVQEARRVLTEAEASLRSLMELGIREQRYADVAEVARLCDAVARLLMGSGAESPATRAPLPPDSTTDSGGNAKPQPRLAAGNRDARGRKTYPRFERDGDKLVKVGWSKKGRAEYEHRAPREAILAFVRHLTSSVPAGKVFTMDNLLPVPDPSGSGELPAYQVYLALAWLRSIGVVEKKGRDGYVRHAASMGSDEFDRLWDSING